MEPWFTELWLRIIRPSLDKSKRARTLAKVKDDPANSGLVPHCAVGYSTAIKLTRLPCHAFLLHSLTRKILKVKSGSELSVMVPRTSRAVERNAFSSLAVWAFRSMASENLKCVMLHVDCTATNSGLLHLVNISTSRISFSSRLGLSRVYWDRVNGKWKGTN